MIEILQYTPEYHLQWDEFVNASRNGTFLFYRKYMEYHSDRFTDCSLIAQRDGKLLAMLPANRDGQVLYSHQGLTFGSWIVPLKHFDVTVMLEIWDAAAVWLKKHGIATVIYKAVPHIYHRYPCEEDLYALFRHNATLVESNISTTILLEDPLGFDRGNKSGTNAARKAGVVVEESEDWAGYWQVLDQVLMERHDTHPVHSLAEIELLHDRFPQNIRLYTATLPPACDDGKAEIVAGVVMYFTRAVAHSQYIASSPRGRELKALPLLFDTLIKSAQEAGYKYFDFGISNENHGRYLNSGLVQQKSRMGGRGIVYNTYKIAL